MHVCIIAFGLTTTLAPHCNCWWLHFEISSFPAAQPIKYGHRVFLVTSPDKGVRVSGPSACNALGFGEDTGGWRGEWNFVFWWCFASWKLLAKKGIEKECKSQGLVANCRRKKANKTNKNQQIQPSPKPVQEQFKKSTHTAIIKTDIYAWQKKHLQIPTLSSWRQSEVHWANMYPVFLLRPCWHIDSGVRLVFGWSQIRIPLETGLSHTSDLKIGTPVATLPGVIGSAQGLVGPGEMASFICNLYLSVAARKLIWADPSLRYTRMFAGTLSNQPINLTRICPYANTSAFMHTCNSHTRARARSHTHTYTHTYADGDRERWTHLCTHLHIWWEESQHD